MNVAVNCCTECGKLITERRMGQLFCSPVCRQIFNDRRMQRGAQLYDLFMVMRYERGLAKALGVWAIICRMAKEWREVDDRERAGRNSWQKPAAAIDRLSVIVRAKDVTIIHNCNGRRRGR